MSALCWAERWDGALCTEVGGDLWFPDKGESVRPARSVCQRCPLIEQCREYIFELEDLHGEQPGIYAGLSVKQRRRIRGPRERVAAQCGTVSGYNAHYRNGENACDDCRAAFRVYHRERAEARRRRAA